MDVSTITSIISIIISFVALVISLRFSQISLRTQKEISEDQNKTKVYLELSKQYGELLRNKPNNICNGQVFSNYMKSYFDFCYKSWSYWEKGIIEDGVFQLWKEDMRKTMIDKRCKVLWIENNYNQNFKSFFNYEIINWEKNKVNK